MSDLQKIVVLCVVLLVGVVGLVMFERTAYAPEPSEGQSVSVDTLPQVPPDVEPIVDEYPEPEPGDTPAPLPDDVGEPLPPIPDEPVACTMEAKMCPDGSFVGRTGPNCEFAPCPDVPEPGVVCTAEQREAEFCAEIYAPVCGQVQVECFTTPCEPVPETFSNSCFACMNERVISYTEGACVAE